MVNGRSGQVNVEPVGPRSSPRLAMSRLASRAQHSCWRRWSSRAATAARAASSWRTDPARVAPLSGARPTAPPAAAGPPDASALAAASRSTVAVARPSSAASDAARASGARRSGRERRSWSRSDHHSSRSTSPTYHWPVGHEGSGGCTHAPSSQACIDSPPAATAMPPNKTRSPSDSRVVPLVVSE